jgi:hypothetical protein
MAAVADWKLRRLSGRAIQVLERHKAAEPAIAAFEPSLVPAAQAFKDAYDKARAHRVSRAMATGTGDEAIASLLKTMRGWLGPLAKDIPGFDARDFGNKPNVHDDVIADAHRLLQVVDRVVEDGVELAYIEALHQDLEPAIATAEVEVGALGTCGADQAVLTRAVREAAATLQAELVAFRRTLRAHIGTSHPDYHRLRATRVSTDDHEDDVAEDLEPEEQATPTEIGLAEAS